jgi:hypothetical protein
MARKSSTQITAEHAKKIIKKLRGKKSSVPGIGQAHPHYDVFSDKGVYLTTLTLRHGADSKKYLGHDHMIEQLLVNAHKAKKIAQCSISRKAWIEEVEPMDDKANPPG